VAGGGTWVREDVAGALLSSMVAHRRKLHVHPEVGMDLPWTQDYVATALRSLGYEPEVRPAAGVTLFIEGRSGRGPIRVLRADMDALPLREKTGLSFSSTVPGAMHACGHDLHMAMLLGAAELFRTSPPVHDVVLAFQPGEESDRGALRVLEHDSLRLPGAAVAFALHVHALLPAGVVTSRPGTFMAHGDWFEITFTGGGGHASAPELAANPIEGMSAWVDRLREVVAELSSGENLVATVTESLAGNTVNVIPTKGSLRGTIRTLSDGARTTLHEALVRITDETADRFGLSGACQILPGYPAVNNDAGFLTTLEMAMTDEPGAVPVERMAQPSMVIEDFAYFLQRWPGAMLYVGAQVEGARSFNHSDDVMFDESAMTTGLALHSLVADLPLTPTPG
jgi:hippurate hydrolase